MKQINLKYKRKKKKNQYLLAHKLGYTEKEIVKMNDAKFEKLEKIEKKR